MLKTLNILTIFPDIITEWTKHGIVQQGIKKKLININIYDLREWGKGKHKQIDDAPYGGGPGMVMMVEPLDRAINKINSEKNIFKCTYCKHSTGFSQIQIPYASKLLIQELMKK